MLRYFKGRKVPPHLQRYRAEDLLAATFRVRHDLGLSWAEAPPHPGNNLAHNVEAAQLAERGLFDMLFWADSAGIWGGDKAELSRMCRTRGGTLRGGSPLTRSTSAVYSTVVPASTISGARACRSRLGAS